MARLIRTRCSGCSQTVDQDPTEYLITEPIVLGEYDNFEHGIYIFTCPSCGYVNKKETTPRIEQLLRIGGVMTLEELEVWLITELTGES